MQKLENQYDELIYKYALLEAETEEEAAEVVEYVKKQLGSFEQTYGESEDFLIYLCIFINEVRKRIRREREERYMSVMGEINRKWQPEKGDSSAKKEEAEPKSKAKIVEVVPKTEMDAAKVVPESKSDEAEVVPESEADEAEAVPESEVATVEAAPIETEAEVQQKKPELRMDLQDEQQAEVEMAVRAENVSEEAVPEKAQEEAVQKEAAPETAQKETVQQEPVQPEASETLSEIAGNTGDAAKKLPVTEGMKRVGMIIATVVMLWMIFGLLMSLGVFPQFDLGYTWFNEHLLTIF